MDSNLANFEALLNICANAVEIFGFAFGATLVALCWIPAANSLRGYTPKLLALGLGTIIYGFMTPTLINLVDGAGSDAILSVIIAPVIALIGFLSIGLIYFVPSIIAFREKRAHKVWILVLNLMVLIPFSWIVCLVWASAGGNESDKPPAFPPLKDFVASLDAPAQAAETTVPPIGEPSATPPPVPVEAPDSTDAPVPSDSAVEAAAPLGDAEANEPAPAPAEEPAKEETPDVL